jgi:hypothetical protein
VNFGLHRRRSGACQVDPGGKILLYGNEYAKKDHKETVILLKPSAAVAPQFGYRPNHI